MRATKCAAEKRSARPARCARSAAWRAGVAQRRHDEIHRAVERREEETIVVTDDLDRAAEARHEDDAAGAHHLRHRDAEVLASHRV